MVNKLLKQSAFITMMGPDGVGKTAIVEYLEAHPDLLGVKGVATILRKMSSEHSQAGADNPAPLPPHGRLKSTVKVILRFLEWQFEYYFGQLARARSKGLMIACDRFFFLDLTIDPLRYRYDGPSWLPQLILDWIPTPDLVFLLDAPAEILYARKREDSVENLEYWRKVYRADLLSRPNTFLIDVSGSMEDACRQISAVVREKLFA
jgi:thymidylate kinase